MKAFTVGCPHCGAKLEVPPGAPSLSLAEGIRLWDIQLAEAFITSLGGITAADDRAFVRVRGRLDAIELSTGKLLWSIGRTN
jgi:hypothetical protein